MSVFLYVVGILSLIGGPIGGLLLFGAVTAASPGAAPIGLAAGLLVATLGIGFGALIMGQAAVIGALQRLATQPSGRPARGVRQQPEEPGRARAMPSPDAAPMPEAWAKQWPAGKPPWERQPEATATANAPPAPSEREREENRRRANEYAARQWPGGKPPGKG